MEVLTVFCLPLTPCPPAVYPFPSNGPSPPLSSLFFRLNVSLSLCFSHLSLTVTHQECVSKDSEYVSLSSGHSEGLFEPSFMWRFLSVSLPLLLLFHLSPAIVNNLLRLWVIPSVIFFFFCSLMILVMASRWKLRRSKILSVTVFIFQLSNPRSSLSPVFWESAPKPESCSQFTRRPSRHYFVHTAMILPSLKFISYITIKDAVCLAEKDRIHHACIYKHPRTHSGSIYLYAFIYTTYLLSSLHFGRSDNSKGMNAH